MVYRTLDTERLMGDHEFAAGRDARNQGPYLLDIELHRDARGSLIALETGAGVPFSLQRVFFIFDVPPAQSRGGHVAGCQELVIALQGSCQATTVQDGAEQVFQLSSPARALYVPANVWVRLDDFSSGALVAVAADRPYTPH